MMPDLPKPEIRAFGTLPDGGDVKRITLVNDRIAASILSFGAILQDVRLAGVPYSVTIGTDDLAGYLGPMGSCGALIGPVVNRISGAGATLDGWKYVFEANQGDGITRHSGSAGTHRKLWNIDEASDTVLTLSLSLLDGEGGFPGNRMVSARFSLDGATLELRVIAETDAPTWVNFANHSYWNLDGTETFAGHAIEIAADRSCASGPDSLVTGEIRPVEGTPLDFRQPREVAPGRPPLDVNLCLADDRREVTEVLTLTGQSGVKLRIATTEPGIQLYDAVNLKAPGFEGHLGRPYAPFAGIAIEAQGWPDAPNNRQFPSIVVRPGERYEQITQYRFEA
jgi:aldose 1-epimerase